MRQVSRVQVKQGMYREQENRHPDGLIIQGSVLHRPAVEGAGFSAPGGQPDPD